MTPPTPPEELWIVRDVPSGEPVHRTNSKYVAVTDRETAEWCAASSSLDWQPVLIGVHPRYREAIQRIMSLVAAHEREPYSHAGTLSTLGRIAMIVVKIRACGKSPTEATP